jgi:hypothetical protein
MSSTPLRRARVLVAAALAFGVLAAAAPAAFADGVQGMRKPLEPAPAVDTFVVEEATRDKAG